MDDSPNNLTLPSPTYKRPDHYDGSSPSSEICRLSRELEEYKQIVFTLQKNLEVKQGIVDNYEAELSANQDELKEEMKNLQQLYDAKLHDIEEQYRSNLKICEESICDLEAELSVVTEKNVELLTALEKSAKNEYVCKGGEDQEALQTELRDALDALTASTAACEQHKELISVLQNEKQEMSDRLKILEEELQNHKEFLTASKLQISEINEQYQDLQEQLALAQAELATLKSTTDMQTRGNSLFAEVEDKRQQLVKQCRQMKLSYNQMKRDYSSKCSEISALKSERRLLTSKLEMAEKEARKHYRCYVDSYEVRIKELHDTINDLKKDVTPVYLNGDKEILKFAEMTMVNSQKEVLRLREEMEWRSALRLNEAAELHKNRGELNRVRTELLSAHYKIEELSELLKKQDITNGDIPEKVIIKSEEDAPVEATARAENECVKRVEFNLVQD